MRRLLFFLMMFAFYANGQEVVQEPHPVYASNHICFGHHKPYFSDSTTIANLSEFEVEFYNRWGELIGHSRNPYFELGDILIEGFQPNEGDIFTVRICVIVNGEDVEYLAHVVFLGDCNCG